MKRFGDLARVVVLAGLAWSATASADAVTDWNEIANGSVAAGRPGPISILDLAVVSLAMHDAVQAYEKRFEPYYVDVAGAKGSRSAAVAAATHGVLVAFYPAQAATLDATYQTWLANNGLTGNAGIAVGEAVATQAATLRRLDPNPLPVPYAGVNAVGQWRSTESFLAGAPPTLAPMASPWMAGFHPFALTGPARYRAPPPPELSSARYAADYNEVKRKGALASSTRTAAQTDVAYFWTDNFFVQWNRGLRAIVEARVNRMGDRARLLALANMSVADAVIASWDTKLNYNLWRPMNAIREGEFDGNARTAGDPAWQPLINNPPYPDYTSGANVVAGAVTRTLQLFFGRDDIPFTLTSNAPAAIKKSRSYGRFSAAAAQVVNARVLLGIHFRFADEAGRTQGRSVAEFVYDHYLLPVSK